MFRLDALIFKNDIYRTHYNLFQTSTLTMIDTAITQNHQFFTVFMNHIFPILNLEDWCCFLMTTKKLWDIRHKFAPSCLELRNYKSFYLLKEMPSEWRNRIYTLDFSCTLVEDISVLSECHNLRHLNLTNTNVKDISALSECHNLRYLNLFKIGVNDISVLNK